MTTFSGHVETITYYNEENHYTIAKLKIDKTDSMATIVGYLAGISPGETVKLNGKWVEHVKYGRQFSVDKFEIILPATINGIKKYLASGVIKGIGKSTANLLVKNFGKNTLDIIENHPEKLIKISGIGKKTVNLITSAWKEHHAVRVLMNFLKENNIKASYSALILKQYGTDAFNIIQQNPYCIANDIPGIGFHVADAIAKNIGIAVDDHQRIKAALFYIIKQAENDGDLFVYKQKLIEQSNNMLKIDSELITKSIESLCENKELVADNITELDNQEIIYLKELYEAEVGIANHLKAMMSVPVQLPSIDRDQITEKVLSRLAIQLSAEQLQVVEEILYHKVAVITGGPGTGKTTLIKAITTIFETLGKTTILTAPTGRAARRLSEVTLREAHTIHKALGCSLSNGYFEKHRDNPLDAYAIIVDEVSMVDTSLMFHLLEAVPVISVIIFVGDAFQLPSVGPGNVLSDIIKSGTIKTFELKSIFRQAQKSPIVINAHKIRKGEFPDFNIIDKDTGLSEFYFIEKNDPEQIVNIIAELCSTRIPKKFPHIDEIQILTPMHKGETGTINLNQILQQVLNKNTLSIEVRGSLFKQGDKVMHLKNNYKKDIFNGDIGVVKKINKEQNLLTVDYYGKIVEYETTELDQLSLSYAISVHKSQGAEYPAIIIPITTQHFILLQRNLLYTAVTRGKELVIIIGTQQAINIALKNDKIRKRASYLVNRINN